MEKSFCAWLMVPSAFEEAPSAAMAMPSGVLAIKMRPHGEGNIRAAGAVSRAAVEREVIQARRRMRVGISWQCSVLEIDHPMYQSESLHTSQPDPGAKEFGGEFS